MGFKGLDSMILNRHGSLISARKFGDILRSVTDYPVSLFLRLAFQYLRYKLPAFAGGYRPPPGDDITLSDFMRQMTGSDNFMDRLASAMVHGISGGNPDTTSLREFHFGLYRNIYHRAKAQLSNRRPDSTKVPIFPADKELLERMSLMLGDITEMVESGAGQTQHYCFVDGMQSLPDWMSNVLATQSNIDLKTNTPVTKVRYDTDARQVLVTSRNNKGEEETQSFDAVVSTIPAQQLVDIAPPSSLPSLESCRSVTIQTVNLWYPRKDLVPKKTLGYLIPRGVSRENNPHRALGVLFDSEAIVPVGSEPSGTKLFVLMGGHFYDSELSPPPDDATAIQQARETVHKQLGIPLDLEPGAAVAKLAKECLPQFEIGHASRMVKAHHELLDAFAGKLSVAGPSYKGMGILGGMRAGWDIAMRLAGRVESAHMGYTGLAGFETMQRDGPISDVFVPHSLVGRFRSDPLKQIYGQQRHQDAQKSARRR
jgi:oxygen-dependent protoporphyrinogen oxidase